MCVACVRLVSVLFLYTPNPPHRHQPTNQTHPKAKLSAKAPFSQYASLKGVKVQWGNPADAAALPDGPFDIVYDNNGKDLDSCKALIDKSKVGFARLVLGGEGRHCGCV
jgi:hypothetical protein